MSNLGELGAKYEKLYGMEDLGRLGRTVLNRTDELGRIPRSLPPLPDETDFTDMLQGIRSRSGLNPGAAPFVPPPPPPRPPMSADAQRMYDYTRNIPLHRTKEDIQKALDRDFKTLAKAKARGDSAASIQKIEDHIRAMTQVLEERGFVGVGLRLPPGGMTKEMIRTAPKARMAPFPPYFGTITDPTSIARLESQHRQNPLNWRCDDPTTHAEYVMGAGWICVPNRK
jgi:hypothetical protein